MPDLFYRTSIYGPPQPLYELPWGDEVFRRSEITYHFYNVDQSVGSVMRTQRALKRIRKSGRLLTVLNKDQAEQIVNAVLLGFLPGADVKTAIEKGTADAQVNEAVESGRIDAALVPLLQDEVLPFRQSPLSGKSLLQIVKNPEALTVAVIIGTGGNPVAVIVLPFGIVAMHVAFKAKKELGRWVEKKLKKWLK